VVPNGNAVVPNRDQSHTHWEQGGANTDLVWTCLEQWRDASETSGSDRGNVAKGAGITGNGRKLTVRRGRKTLKLQGFQSQ
jgi:hypothetical protein